MKVNYINGDEVEIPREAFPFVIGYLTGGCPDMSREAVAAWHRSEAEFERVHRERLEREQAS